MTKQVRRIDSNDNKLFKTWSRLLQSQGVNKLEQFVLPGEKIVPEVLANHVDLAVAIVKREEHGLPMGTPDSLPTYDLKATLFRELDDLGTNAPLLVGQIPKIATWHAKDKPEGLEVFLALQDPGNLGGAIRTALAFGASKVIILEESAHPFLPRALKAAAGATFNIPLLWGPSITKLEPEHKFYTLDGKGQNLQDFKWPKHLRLLLGEEGRGVPPSLRVADQTISIPINDKLESLNASVAFGIALHQRVIQMTKGA